MALRNEIDVKETKNEFKEVKTTSKQPTSAWQKLDALIRHCRESKVKVPIVLDTDIGEDPDDIKALLCLLATPHADIKCIVTTGVFADEKARLVKAILRSVGKDKDIPVYAGEGIHLSDLKMDNGGTPKSIQEAIANISEQRQKEYIKAKYPSYPDDKFGGFCLFPHLAYEEMITETDKMDGKIDKAIGCIGKAIKEADEKIGLKGSPKVVVASIGELSNIAQYFKAGFAKDLIIQQMGGWSSSGYNLALMSSLPEKKKEKAKNGIIYVSEDGKYVVRDVQGVVQEGSLDAKDFDLSKLSKLEEKLRTPDLKSTLLSEILKVTTKVGHTWPSKTNGSEIFPYQYLGRNLIADIPAAQTVFDEPESNIVLYMSHLRKKYDLQFTGNVRKLLCLAGKFPVEKLTNKKAISFLLALINDASLPDIRNIPDYKIVFSQTKTLLQQMGADDKDLRENYDYKNAVKNVDKILKEEKISLSNTEVKTDSKLLADEKNINKESLIKNLINAFIPTAGVSKMEYATELGKAMAIDALLWMAQSAFPYLILSDPATVLTVLFPEFVTSTQGATIKVDAAKAVEPGKEEVYLSSDFEKSIKITQGGPISAIDGLSSRDDIVRRVMTIELSLKYPGVTYDEFMRIANNEKTATHEKEKELNEICRKFKERNEVETARVSQLGLLSSSAEKHRDNPGLAQEVKLQRSPL